MRKKEKQLCVITLMIKKEMLLKKGRQKEKGKCDNLKNYNKEQLRKYDKRKK